jgi:hypothetical protein
MQHELGNSFDETRNHVGVGISRTPSGDVVDVDFVDLVDLVDLVDVVDLVDAVDFQCLLVH